MQLLSQIPSFLVSSHQHLSRSPNRTGNTCRKINKALEGIYSLMLLGEASVHPPQFWEKVSAASYPTPSTIMLLASFLEVCGNNHFAAGHYLEGQVVWSSCIPEKV